MKVYVKGKPFIQNGLGAHLCQVAPYEMVICTGLKAIHFVQAIPRGIAKGLHIKIYKELSS